MEQEERNKILMLQHSLLKKKHAKVIDRTAAPKPGNAPRPRRHCKAAPHRAYSSDRGSGEDWDWNVCITGDGYG